MGGLAGALLVFYLTAWNPAAFLAEESFILMAAIVIGGPGNYWGAVLGTFVFVEFLTEIARYFPNIGNGDLVGAGRAIFIGIVLIVVVRFRPEGLVPERWLHWYGKPGKGGSTGRSSAGDLGFRRWWSWRPGAGATGRSGTDA